MTAYNNEYGKFEPIEGYHIHKEFYEDLGSSGIYIVTALRKDGEVPSTNEESKNSGVKTFLSILLECLEKFLENKKPADDKTKSE